MRVIVSYGKNVICEAPAAQAVESKVVGGTTKGFGVIANKDSVVALKVLYPDSSYDMSAGDLVYVRQERLMGSTWGKPLEMTIDQEKVAIVALPLEEVLMVESQESEEG